jgi:pyruvate/2-oxoglutarate dehydrogenase complex dihydrolipoamide dehydrogenase (E3) component
MVASARVAYLARRAPDYGIRTGPVRVDLARVRERKREIVSSFRAGSERALEKAGVTLVQGAARFVQSHEISVVGTSGDGQLGAPLIFINVGQRPARPALPGLDNVRVLDSTSIMELSTVPQHLVVLGGGYVGLEFAQMFRRFGAAVTVITRADRLLPREDDDVSAAMRQILAEDEIDVVLQAKPAEVLPEADGLRLVIRGPEGTPPHVSGSHLLVAVGRVPNTDDLGLPAAGVGADQRGYIRVNERLETSVPGVYALGDVTGGPAFTHWSYDDFRILRTNLLENGDRTTTDRILPYTIYTDPQLGRIGLTEREARERGHAVRIAKLPMSSVARAIETDEQRGFLKAVVDADSQRILGAAVLGTEGGEIATLFQIAMLGNLPYTVLRDGIFAHPTFAESLNNVFTAMERSVA